ncbi:L-fuculose-phosphate aldolase [Polycladomyces abyssicola]|uniref:L-fuculose-phosphate aldolase n=1 Tax=Polycladomyces abyssicola TaxID=1125966 RepID=A0A8D5ZNG6_9BACL|nr:class II aldolase/adducin family protein [Polycladomyces abyssicola]BCU81333.1 L-fuculose-phosphate aldolase [Polycladomyces abyssicola]
MLYFEERKDLCEVARMMFDRLLTNAAGGNISVKMSDSRFIMTPSLMSQQKFCRLKPEEILVVDSNGNILEGDGQLTREFNMHMAAYDAMPDAGAVIHAHPKESMVFASLGLEMPHMCEATRKLGEIRTLEYAPATSKDLADRVYAYLRSRAGDIPVATLLREHGILVIDKTLRKAYDMLERIEFNAYVNIQAKLFELMGAVKGDNHVHSFSYHSEE